LRNATQQLSTSHPRFPQLAPREKRRFSLLSEHFLRCGISAVGVEKILRVFVPLGFCAAALIAI